MLPLFLTKLLIRTGLARLLPPLRRRAAGSAAYLHYYSDRVLSTPLTDAAAAVRLLNGEGADVLTLTGGSPSWDLTPSASTWQPADRRGTPPPGGLPQLRQAVAEHLAAEQGLAVRSEDEVQITAGASGALAAALDAFVNPGDAVILFDPTSLLYPFFLRSRRARIRWVPTEQDAGRIHVRFDRLARALHRARMLILTCPASPTGGIFAAEDLEQIAWWAARQDVLLYVDKVLARFQYEGEPSCPAALPKMRQRTVTAGSVSKGHALAWARVGWLAGDRRLLGPCGLTAASQGQLVPAVCQQLARAALAQGREPVVARLKELESRRRYVFDRLRALGLKPVWPAGGFFFWVKVGQPGLNGAAFADRLLRQKKVAVWPGHFFGPAGKDYIRLSYVADEGRLREGLSRLGELVGEKKQLALAA